MRSGWKKSGKRLPTRRNTWLLAIIIKTTILLWYGVYGES